MIVAISSNGIARFGRGLSEKGESQKRGGGFIADMQDVTQRLWETKEAEDSIRLPITFNVLRYILEHRAPKDGLDCYY